MNVAELTKKLVNRHFPERVWIKNFLGKWHSVEAEPSDIESREQWVRHHYKPHFDALEKGVELEIEE
jgi:hypothetical protein